ncbi:MAG: hypothetical protein JW803_09515 [Endomicrobiales bacterium]|nr:hypothetical protein [Endomicrobiales bacterium]
MNKEQMIKKLKPALAVGTCAGGAAAFIVYFEGLKGPDMFAYFFFWLVISVIVFFANLRAPGWLKGLVFSETFALPVFITMYYNDYSYIIPNIMAINGFLGLFVGYFSGLTGSDSREMTRRLEGIPRRILVCAASGAAAGALNLIFIILAGRPVYVMYAAVANWIVLSFLVSLVNLPFRNWLTGAITVEAAMLPMFFLFALHMPESILPTFILSAALGAALGAVNRKHALLFTRDPASDTDAFTSGGR